MRAYTPPLHLNNRAWGVVEFHAHADSITYESVEVRIGKNDAGYCALDPYAPAVEAMLAALPARRAREDLLIDFGTTLLSALFQGNVATAYRACLNSARARSAWLLLTIDPPLRVLVVSATPQDSPLIDAERAASTVKEALALRHKELRMRRGKTTRVARRGGIFVTTCYRPDRWKQECGSDPLFTR